MMVVSVAVAALVAIVIVAVVVVVVVALVVVMLVVFGCGVVGVGGFVDVGGGSNTSSEGLSNKDGEGGRRGLMAYTRRWRTRNMSGECKYSEQISGVTTRLCYRHLFVSGRWSGL